jgi:hypothetical protein
MSWIGPRDQAMLSHRSSFLVFLTFCAIFWLGTSQCPAQNSIAEFQKILREKSAFSETDFSALEQGEAVVKLLPARDKREVVVSGLVRLQAPDEIFLESFRENMIRRSNPAILEIGSFSSPPTLDDLQLLTIEDRDIEDLKRCVVGDCRLKLSAAMIERFQKEVDWLAPDYRIQATQLFKLMLLDYVRDYLTRGDAALIEYYDKQKQVRVAEEQRSLLAAPGYLNELLTRVPRFVNGSSSPQLLLVENAIVWSKIKFGLKPVIALNHILIHRREHETGPQILIASKQIYANHYFDSSLALTAFVNIPGASPGSYLLYENRSRADGFEGPFSKFKRSIVENKALESVKAILHQSQLSLEARALNQSESSTSAGTSDRSWKRWTSGRVRIFVWLLCLTAFAVLIRLSAYGWKSRITGRTAH